MDFRLLYTQAGLDDLAQIVGHIADDDGAVASRFGSALLDHVDLLGRFPRMGSVVDGRAGVRRLVHTPFVAYYRVHEDRHLIEILHFRHGSRQMPDF
jgi:plasmid stabilization system protein ParE